MNQERLAILLPHLGGGGAEGVAVNLANSFAQRGYDVDMVLLSSKGERLVDLRPEIRVIDLQISRIHRALMPLVHYMRQAQPDAMLANMWPLTLIALLARKLARVSTRMVVAEHTTWSRDPITSSVFGRWRVCTTMHLFYPQADSIVAVSLGAADDLAQMANLDRNTITVIYNPIVGKEIPLTSGPLAPSGWWLGAHHKILAVGGLRPIKDYATLLAALAHLRESVNARLLILGEGCCRSSLTNQARQLGIEDSLFMPGFVKDPSPYFRQTDLFVLSSTGEGFGNVIVEALAVGAPVVSTDCQSGPREILCGGNFGRLVPVGNSAKLAKAMAESLASKHNAPSLIERANYFSIDKAVVKYEELLFPNSRTKVGA